METTYNIQYQTHYVINHVMKCDGVDMLRAVSCAIVSTTPRDKRHEQNTVLIYIYIYTHIYISLSISLSLSLYIYIYICILCIYIYIYIYTYVCLWYFFLCDPTVEAGTTAAAAYSFVVEKARWPTLTNVSLAQESTHNCQY